MNIIYKWDYINEYLDIIYNENNINDNDIIEYIIISYLKENIEEDIIISDKIIDKDGYYLIKIDNDYILYEKRNINKYNYIGIQYNENTITKIYKFSNLLISDYHITMNIELDNIINLLASYKDNKNILKKIINSLEYKILHYRDNNATILHKLALKYCDEIHNVIRELLLNKKIRILLNIQDKDGNTAAILGVKYNNNKFVDELDDAGADLSIKNYKGFYINESD